MSSEPVRRRILAAGYSPDLTERALTKAEAHGFDDANDGFNLTMSYILYREDEVAAGARFGADDGFAPC